MSRAQASRHFPKKAGQKAGKFEIFRFSALFSIDNKGLWPYTIKAAF
jgi:hypothetical protein